VDAADKKTPVLVLLAVLVVAVAVIQRVVTGVLELELLPKDILVE
jgi:hypothetical protein